MLLRKSHYVLAACIALATSQANADVPSVEHLLDMPLEDLLNVNLQVGSRTGDKHLNAHKLPVDVVTADDLRRSGYSELPKVLNHLVSSFTAVFATINDLTDHVRPFSLNGLKPDQVLVLINGKRVHQSAVVDVNDTQSFGSSSVDLNLIPIEAIERIEILRDDASAQYGSDAIAGVINIVLKRTKVNEAVITAGQRQAGDGDVFSGSYNYGDGKNFFSLEYKHKSRSNSSGLDRRDYYFSGDPGNGDYRVTHIYGDPHAQSLSLSFNGEELFGSEKLYALGKAVYKEGESTGFFRRALDDRNVRAIYPDGFLPQIKSGQLDLFSTLGFKKEGADYSYDISNTFGYNHMDIGVDQSLNASLGAESPKKFDAGKLRFWHNTLNADATQTIHWAHENPLHLAYGGEYRHEEAGIHAGEWASWVDGLVPILDGPNQGEKTVGGAQVYPGFSPSNVNHSRRDVLAFYGEASHQLTSKTGVSLSLRDEHYSDFGNTLNGKLLLDYVATDTLNIRASISTGYRAPSLQQLSYYRTATSSRAEANGDITLLENGVFPVDHEAASLLGAQELDPEKSRRANLGFTWKPNPALQINLDFFKINIDERIILSGEIESQVEIPTQAKQYMADHNIAFARYFLNGVDTSTHGFDASIKYRAQLLGRELNLNAQWHQQHIHLEALNIPDQLAQIAQDVFNRSEQERLQHYLPENKGLISANYQLDDWTILLRANYFDKVLYVPNPNDPAQDQWFDSKVTFDAELSYQLTTNTTIAAGGHNIFNTRPDTRRQNPPLYGAGNVLPYTNISPFDYNGAFFYLRLQAGF